MKRLKRITMVRIRRPFALTQFLLILIIIYLIKRTRDRHRPAKDEDYYRSMRIAEPFDPDADIGLFEDSARGRHQELFGNIDKKSDAFSPPESGRPTNNGSFFEAANVQAYDVLDPVPVLDQSDTGIPHDPPSTAGDQVPKEDLSTFHFPVAGEEIPLGSLVGDAAGRVQDTAGNVQDTVALAHDNLPGVLYDEEGLEIIQRPAVMADVNPRRFSLEVTEDMINTFSVVS